MSPADKTLKPEIHKIERQEFCSRPLSKLTARWMESHTTGQWCWM